MSLNGHGDVFGIWWDRRNADLRFVLNSWQFDKYMSLAHFYRPVAWKAGGWTNGRGHNAGNGNHNTPNRQIAHNTNAHHSGSGHFGGRR
jgi:hypothetical protein